MSKKGLTPQEVKPLLAGVINIQFTPFKSATEIDEEALRDNTRFMIEGGIVTGRGVQVIGGSNGEGFSLSDDEYRQLIDVVVDEAAGRVPICVGCVRPATEPVIELARYAEEAGADAMMILSPHYYSNPSDDLVYEHFKTIADATNIGIMIYDNPGVTGKDLSVEALTRLAEIENIVALKETTQNMYKLREAAYRLGDRFTINANTYRWMMPFDYQIGVVGHNNFFANFDPAFALRVEDIDKSGDFEQNNELWTNMLDYCNFVFTKGMYKATAYGKEMARIVGQPMGDYERLPLQRPPEEERLKLRELMKKAGMAYGPPD
jgi:4-hydroxy-tetrahydrodipicolinate synthase